MLQLLEKIMGLVVKAAEGLRSHKDAQLRGDFAWNLTQCYLRLLEIIEDGESIVRQIEFFVRRFGEHLERDDDWKYFTSAIDSAVLRQSVNIRRLDVALVGLKPALHVLSQPTALELGTLLAGKCSILAYLSAVLERGRFAVDVQYSPATAAPFARDWCRDPDGISTDPQTLVVKHMEELDIRGDWGITQYEALATFLKERRPWDVLDSLKLHAEQLASLIKDRFTLEEILKTVEKLRNR